MPPSPKDISRTETSPSDAITSLGLVLFAAKLTRLGGGGGEKRDRKGLRLRLCTVHIYTEVHRRPMRVKNERTENHYIIIVAICITNLFVLGFFLCQISLHDNYRPVNNGGHFRAKRISLNQRQKSKSLFMSHFAVYIFLMDSGGNDSEC